MIKNEEIVKVFDQFWDDVRKDARKNLRAVGKGGGRLDRRMFDVTKSFKNSVQSEFFIEDYGKFVDKGVRGVGGIRKYKDGVKLENPTTWKLKKVTNNLYSYKNKRPPASKLDKFSVRRGLAPRSGGRFTSREGLKHALSKTVFHEGLETTNFLTDAFNKHFKELPEEVGEAYGLQLDKFFKSSVK